MIRFSSFFWKTEPWKPWFLHCKNTIFKNSPCLIYHIFFMKFRTFFLCFFVRKSEENISSKHSHWSYGFFVDFLMILGLIWYPRWSKKGAKRMTLVQLAVRRVPRTSQGVTLGLPREAYWRSLGPSGSLLGPSCDHFGSMESLWDPSVQHFGCIGSSG